MEDKSTLYQNLIAYFFICVRTQTLLAVVYLLLPCLTGSEKYLGTTRTVEKWQPEIKISIWDEIETMT